MKLFALLASALIVLFPASSSSQSRLRDITVQGIPLTPARWVATVSKKLDAVLVYPNPVYWTGDGAASGIVSVQFQTDAQNRPIALSLARSSRNRILDRFGMRAIERLGPLPVMPIAFKPGQRFRANIVYAASYDEYNRQLVILRKEEAARRMAAIASPDSVAAVVSLGAGTAS
ncbi:energy transducer TonB [Sphingomonas sp. A2-49]|uniref:energy transducer TonB family protein n=1 Tax=Sphingomonas sp. A2-49 TaxID=1391375 RepID=UPI0021CEE669|nr:energy transducer TonB [Sphingomonas sp. A2-49]MCU6453503.1 energy transducer TonB [Sphingomonas sp. A2-49]